MAKPISEESTGAALEAVFNSRSISRGLAPFVDIFVESSVAADFSVFVSIDKADWLPYEAYDMSVGAGENAKAGFANGFQYIKVVTANIGNHKIVISGSP